MKYILNTVFALCLFTVVHAQNIDMSNTLSVLSLGAPGANPSWPGSSGRTPVGYNDQLSGLLFETKHGFANTNAINIDPVNTMKMIISVPISSTTIVSGGSVSPYWSAGTILPATVTVAGITYQQVEYTLMNSIPANTPAVASMQMIATAPADKQLLKIYMNFTGTGSRTIINYDAAHWSPGFIAGLGAQHTLRINNPAVVNNDINIALTNVQITGNVSSNDFIPAGTFSYGNPTGGNTNGTLTLNSNGSYTFTGTAPGVYTYIVPLTYTSGAGTITNNEVLTITVIDPHVTSNNPVVNTDLAAMTSPTPTASSSVLIQTLANDFAGNAGGTLNPASVTIITPPATAGATTAIDATTGAITYTLPAGSTKQTGKDSIQYQVCDNSTPIPKCGTAWQIITIDPAGTPNHTMAADDYVPTPGNTAVSGNAKTNDMDPDGSAQHVTPQTTTIPGKGTLTLLADGSFTFIPVNGFAGTVDYPYTTCNSVTAASPGQACATATIHVLVYPIIPDLTPTVDIDNLNFPVAGTSRDFVVNVIEINGAAAINPITVRITKLSAFTITYSTASGLSNVNGGTTNENNNWIFTEDANFVIATAKPGVTIPANGSSKLGFTITRNTNVFSGTIQNLTTVIEGGSGGEINTSNNSKIVTFFTKAPTN